MLETQEIKDSPACRAADSDDLTLRLKRAGASLLELASAMRLQSVDARALRDFRDAVDHIRKTSWVLQEMHERKLQHRDGETAATLLTQERIRRMTEMSRNLMAELSSESAVSRMPGLRDMVEALSALVERLNALCTRPAGR